MATRDTINSIEPGSVPHGDRKGLEQSLQDVLASPEGGPPVEGEAAAPIPTSNDPVGALLGGELAPNNDVPLTSGMSVGPGNNTDVNNIMLTDRANQLRLLATQAITPSLRATALRMLKRMTQGSEPV